MANFIEIQNEINDSGGNRAEVLNKYIKELEQRTGRNVVLYYSGFIQNPSAPSNLLSINDGDMDAFMQVFHGLDYEKGLDLIIQTPGGDIGATEAIVNYIKKQFGNNFRVIVPHCAFSAGTMIACASKEILMGNHSSLGPIDPQLGALACHGILDEVAKIKEDLAASPNNRYLWEPILAKYSPTLIDTCEKAIELSDSTVTKWLSENMFEKEDNPIEKARKSVEFFGSRSQNKMHARHISSTTAKNQGLNIFDIEKNQELQDSILNIHHILNIILEESLVVKIIQNSIGTSKLKVFKKE